MELGLSIVICTHNGRNRLGLVLEHINLLHIPNNLLWEVIVVDNASTDDTAIWVDKLISSNYFNFDLCLFQENNPGLNIARLTGAKNAKYDWLLFCDDDNLIEFNYLEIWHESIISNHNIGAVGGKGIAIIDNYIPDWFNEYSHSYAVGSQYLKSGLVVNGSGLYGACLFVLKTPILNIVNSGFKMVMADRELGKLSSGGDLEWCYLIQLSGLKLYYNDRMIFKHQIAEKRLNWDYYIQLKSGIASGIGLLESYHFIFNHGYRNSFLFVLHYFYRLFFSFLIYYSYWIKTYIFHIPKIDHINKLTLIVLQCKAYSYFTKFRFSFFHYKRLKKSFNAFV
jgi:glycosyltransferase involved in cell wall biosynthesis